MKAMTAVAVLAVACAGCSTLKREPINTFDGSTRRTVGSVTTWSPDKAAAVVVNDKMCMQLPTRLVSLGTENTAAGVAKLGDAFTAQGVKGTEMGGVMNSYFSSTASSAIVPTERTTFLSFGLFYLCQMAMNDSIKEPQVEQMIRFLVTESAKIGVNAEAAAPKQPPPQDPPVAPRAEPQ